jgi:hypothetical protein
MAKDKEATETEGGEKQASDKPKRNPGELGFMQILIFLGGTVVLLFVLLIIGYFIFIKPDLQKITTAGGEDKAKTENVKKDSESETVNPDEFKKEENERFISTGRITTNPKMSTQFVVVDFGLDFYVSDLLGKSIKKDKPEESSEMLKPLSAVKGEINNLLGSYTVEELQAIPRDSLQSRIKSRLINVFTQNKMMLKDAILQEFIIQ